MDPPEVTNTIELIGQLLSNMSKELEQKYAKNAEMKLAAENERLRAENENLKRIASKDRKELEISKAFQVTVENGLKTLKRVKDLAMRETLNQQQPPLQPGEAMPPASVKLEQIEGAPAEKSRKTTPSKS